MCNNNFYCHIAKSAIVTHYHTRMLNLLLNISVGFLYGNNPLINIL